MSIELKGMGYVNLHASDWDAVKEIAIEFDWLAEYEAGEDPRLGYAVPKHNARALARALYRAIQMIETDSLSETLVELVKEAGVGNLREVADLAYAGGFYID